MNVIRKKEIKYIKLCLVSPALEHIISILYIISFPLLAFKFMTVSNNYSNYQMTGFVRHYLKEEEFRNISSVEMFVSYVDFLTETLHTFDPKKNIPLVIPFGGIRMKKYSVKSSLCSDLLKDKPKCDSFSCTIAALDDIHNHTKCLLPYSPEISNEKVPSNSTDIFEDLINNLPGYYSNYDLMNDGESIDFTLDEYKGNKDYFLKFIGDLNLKFIVLMYSLYCPTTGLYINIISGIEMISYFTHTYPIFTTCNFSIIKEDDIYFFVVYIFFTTSVVLNILKLIYEMNIKLMIAIHFFGLLNEVLNLLIMIFMAFYMSASKMGLYFDQAKFDKKYQHHIPLISIKNYINLFISVSIICFPFRFLSFFSWYEKASKPIVKYLIVIFRMLPGILIAIVITCTIAITFALMNYFLYNESFYQFSNILNSIFSVFNVQVINELYSSDKILHSLSYSPLLILINVLIAIFLILIIIILTATVVFLFRKASAIEIDKEENEIMLKLKEIEDKLSTEKDNDSSRNLNMTKQIIWLGLSSKNDLYNEFSVKNKILLFKSSNQIISFLKYLFAIKPEMQFKNLDKKFSILIECKSENFTLKENELDQIDSLFEWLNFAGCKIPVAIYTQMRLDKNLRMSIIANYLKIHFVNDREDIHHFFGDRIDDEKKETGNFEISKGVRFGLSTISRGSPVNCGGSINPTQPASLGNNRRSTMIRPSSPKAGDSLLPLTACNNVSATTNIGTNNKITKNIVKKKTFDKKLTLSQNVSNNSISEESRENLIEDDSANNNS